MGHTLPEWSIEAMAVDMRQAKERHLQALATMNDQIKAITPDRMIGGQTRFLDKNGEPITAARLITETIRSDFQSADTKHATTLSGAITPADMRAAVSEKAGMPPATIGDLIAERDDLRKRLVAAEAVNHTLRSWLAQGKVDYARGYADGLAAAAKAVPASPQASVSPQDAAVGRAITQKGQRP